MMSVKDILEKIMQHNSQKKLLRFVFLFPLFFQDLLISKQLPDDISWHFIGKIQSNKVKQIISVPNLFLVESVDREKIANSLNKALESSERKDPLHVLVQVNPADEETKSGVSSEESLSQLVNYILQECPKLNFKGLMVIGRPGKLEDMDMLVTYKNHLIDKFPGLKDLDPFELSMGMSSDYVEAVCLFFFFFSCLVLLN